MMNLRFPIADCEFEGARGTLALVRVRGIYGTRSGAAVQFVHATRGYIVEFYRSRCWLLACVAWSVIYWRNHP
jgi:hypothetical protein